MGGRPSCAERRGAGSISGSAGEVSGRAGGVRTVPNPDKLAAIAALRDALRCAQSALELIDGADDDKLRELAGSPVLLPTIRQGADIAGISRSAMYRLIDAGQMPTVEIAGVSGKRIKRSDLERL